MRCKVRPEGRGPRGRNIGDIYASYFSERLRVAYVYSCTRRHSVSDLCLQPCKDENKVFKQFICPVGDGVTVAWTVEPYSLSRGRAPHHSTHTSNSRLRMKQMFKQALAADATCEARRLWALALVYVRCNIRQNTRYACKVQVTM